MKCMNKYKYCIVKKIRRSNRRIFRRYLRKYSDIPKSIIRRMKYKKLYNYFESCSWHIGVYSCDYGYKEPILISYPEFF